MDYASNILWIMGQGLCFSSAWPVIRAYKENRYNILPVRINLTLFYFGFLNLISFLSIFLFLLIEVLSPWMIIPMWIISVPILTAVGERIINLNVGLPILYLSGLIGLVFLALSAA